MLKVGDRLFNGSIVTPALAAAYNRACERVRSFQAEGKPVPEQLLNGKHNLLNGFIENEERESSK